MKQMRLWMPLAALGLVLIAPLARAQYTDPDPCFDASTSKSQYEACVADSGGGNSGSGGATMPPCLRCVVGYWDVSSPYPSAQCKDPTDYKPQAAGDWSGCKAVVWCWPDGYGGRICEARCDGNACYTV